jgi:hypothetical protein
VKLGGCLNANRGDEVTGFSRRLHDVYYSSDIIRRIKPRRMGPVEHATRIGERGKA